MGIQCFGIEKTGNEKQETKTEWCEQCKCNHTDTTNYVEWKRLDTNETYWARSCYDHPLGAMYFQEYIDVHYDSKGENIVAQYKGNGQWNNDDGNHLIVVVPCKWNGSDGQVYDSKHFWDVDSRGSNCDMKQDRLHRCWVRHGTIPNITVDKNGVTCGAGAGSILVEGWHGFLRNGILEQC